MLDVQTKSNSVIDFIKKKKTVILATTAAVLGAIVVIQNTAIQNHNEFLKEHDLYDTYYADPDEN